MDEQTAPFAPAPSPAWCPFVVAASAVIGLALIADQAVRMSATFDEFTYLLASAHWWRTGDQDAITRMGVPITS